jgi:hypothetical protein
MEDSMAHRDDEDELEQIVRKDKPGFTIERRGEPRRGRKDVSLPSDSTPDTEHLRTKARELERGAKAKPGGPKARKGSDAGSSESSDPLVEKYLGKRSSAKDDTGRHPTATRGADTDDIRIVDVRPEHASDSPDRPMKPKKVIISRSAKKIIGEQG